MAEIEKLDGKNLDIVDQNIEQLKELFPSVFSEGRIQFNKLEELLGHYVVDDEDHYNFTWHGKRKAGRLSQTPSTGTLRPRKEESVDWDTTENIFIEGDNLEVLKLLQKSYHRQVKMIYIDPPYNTGNDFVYEDDFKDGVKNYLEMTGQLDGDGKKVGTNSSAAGRFHTNWLNMMYPRLKLARNLLSDDGVIFISIDDNEQSNLKRLCDNIFGEENGLVPFIWSLPRGINAGHVSRAHEYILGYAKKKDHLSLFNKLDQTEFSIDRCNKKVDRRHPASEITFPAGIRYEGKDQVITGEIKGSESIEIQGELVFKNDQLIKEVTLKAGWTMKNMILDWLDGKDVLDSKGQEVVEFFFKENGKLYSKKRPIFESPKSILSDVPDTQVARVEIEELFGDQDIFSYPKPAGLLQKLIEYTTKEGDIILDFFAGSCSTGQGLLQSNLSKKINRNYIVVQLPEKLDARNEDQRAALEFCQDEKIPENIAEIGKERLRRVRKKLLTENQDYEGDLGFKVFKLDSSNIKRWDADFDTLEQDLVDAADYLVEGRSDEDVLYELCLKLGLDLSVRIEEKVIAGEKLFVLGRGYLVVCLSDNVTMDLVNGIGDLKKELEPEDGMRIVFKDDGFKDDVVKTNALQTLKRFDIDDIKSL